MCVCPVIIFSVLCSQSSQMSDVTSRELHSQAQEQLQHYLMGRALEERAQQHREGTHDGQQWRGVFIIGWEPGGRTAGVANWSKCVG